MPPPPGFSMTNTRLARVLVTIGNNVFFIRLFATLCLSLSSLLELSVLSGATTIKSGSRRNLGQLKIEKILSSL